MLKNINSLLILLGKIYLTNWVHLVAVFLALYITDILLGVSGIITFAPQALFAENLYLIPYAMVTRGRTFLFLLLTSFVVLDTVLFFRRNRHVTEKILLQTSLICSVVFLYAMNSNSFYLYLIAISIIPSQLIRRDMLRSLYNTYTLRAKERHDRQKWEQTLHCSMRDFAESKKFVQSLHLKSESDWRAYCRSGNKPRDIPACPQIFYLNKGWQGLEDWLGIYESHNPTNERTSSNV
jgi:hypothetical protein